MRAIGGLILGLIAAVVVAIFFGIIAVIATFSMPPGLDPGNTRQVLEAFANAPAGTLIGLGIAWSLGALAGAWVARRVGGASWAAWAVTLLVAGYFGFSGWVLPFPVWAKALWALGPLAGGILGNRAPAAAAVPDPAAEI